MARRKRGRGWTERERVGPAHNPPVRTRAVVESDDDRWVPDADGGATGGHAHELGAVRGHTRTRTSSGGHARTPRGSAQRDRKRSPGRQRSRHRSRDRDRRGRSCSRRRSRSRSRSRGRSGRRRSHSRRDKHHSRSRRSRSGSRARKHSRSRSRSAHRGRASRSRSRGSRGHSRRRSSNKRRQSRGGGASSRSRRRRTHRSLSSGNSSSSSGSGRGSSRNGSSPQPAAGTLGGDGRRSAAREVSSVKVPPPRVDRDGSTRDPAGGVQRSPRAHKRARVDSGSVPYSPSAAAHEGEEPVSSAREEELRAAAARSLRQRAASAGSASSAGGTPKKETGAGSPTRAEEALREAALAAAAAARRRQQQQRSAARGQDAGSAPAPSTAASPIAAGAAGGGEGVGSSTQSPADSAPAAVSAPVPTNHAGSAASESGAAAAPPPVARVSSGWEEVLPAVEPAANNGATKSGAAAAVAFFSKAAATLPADPTAHAAPSSADDVGPDAAAFFTKPSLRSAQRSTSGSSEELGASDVASAMAFFAKPAPDASAPPSPDVTPAEAPAAAAGAAKSTPELTDEDLFAGLGGRAKAGAAATNGTNAGAGAGSTPAKPAGLGGGWAVVSDGGATGTWATKVFGATVTKPDPPPVPLTRAQMIEQRLKAFMMETRKKIDALGITTTSHAAMSLPAGFSMPAASSMPDAGAAVGAAGAGAAASKAQAADATATSASGAGAAAIGDLGKTDDSGDKYLDGNWDDEDGYYNVRVGEVLHSRYKVIERVGRGVFSFVVRATDLMADTMSRKSTTVAIKIVRRNDMMQRAAEKEIRVLTELAQADPEDRRRCIRLLAHFQYRHHPCMVFESMEMDLRKLTKKVGRGQGLSLVAVRSFGKQLFVALKLVHSLNYVHADLKPDNVVVGKKRSLIKLCDFGSVIPVRELPDYQDTSYIQSRYYRAPEVALGGARGTAMDIWSAACLLFELFASRILFFGEDNRGMIQAQIEVLGRVPTKVLKKSRFASRYFNDRHQFVSSTTHRVLTQPKRGDDLQSLLLRAAAYGGLDAPPRPGKDGKSEKRRSHKRHAKQLTPDERASVLRLKDLLTRCFAWDPAKRLTADAALRHPFFRQELAST